MNISTDIHLHDDSKIKTMGTSSGGIALKFSKAGAVYPSQTVYMTREHLEALHSIVSAALADIDHGGNGAIESLAEAEWDQADEDEALDAAYGRYFSAAVEG